MKKAEPITMASSEVISLFTDGLSITMLARRMSGKENISVREARNRVMEIIYNHQMDRRRAKQGKSGDKP